MTADDEYDLVDALGGAGSPIRAIQDAALERALLSRTQGTAHVRLAGALEQTRTNGEHELSLGSAAMLTCLVSLHLTDDPSLPSRIEPPVAGHYSQRGPLLVGALVAFDRFDISVETAASLANRSVDDFEAELERR